MTTVAEEDLPWRTNLREDELPGKIELSLNDQWQPLPALTPSDQLRAIRLSLPTGEPVTDFELARSEKTGQLLVKSQEALTSQVTIDFIIAPDQGYFTQLKTGESMRLQENLCSERFGELLDERIFYPETDSDDAYQELQAINEIDDIPKRLNALMDWLDTFSDDTNVTGDDEELLLAMLREKQGVCRHKSMIFQMLCQYWGIPARQVTNASHVFVEISPDGGNTWRQYQLGGGGQSSSDTTEPDWGDYHRSGNSVLRPPNERSTHLQSAISDYGHPSVRKQSELEKSFEELWDKLSSNEAIKNGELDRLKVLILEELKNTKITDINQRYFILLHPSFASDREMTDLFIRLVERTGIANHWRYYYKDISLQDIPFNTLDDYSGKDQEEYISMLCDVCESSDVFKKFALGKLQYKAKTQNDFPCRDRILKMVSTMSFPDFKVQLLDDKKKTDAVGQFIHDLPNSKYLESKIATVNIDRKYTTAPKENSEIVPENLATGLPAFLSQSTMKESKPVIVDLCIMGPEMDQRIKSYIANHADKTDKKTELCQLIEKNQEMEDRDDEYMMMEGIKDAFFTWVAQHQLKANNEWRWLSDEYTTCHLQSSPTEVPNHYNSFKSGRRVPFEQSSEAIRTRLKEPTAIVLKEKDLLIMLDEFLSMA